MKELLLQIDELMKEEVERKRKMWQERIEREIKRSYDVEKRVFHLYYRDHLRIGFLDIGKHFVNEELEDIKKKSAEDKRWFIEKIREQMESWEVEKSYVHTTFVANVINKKDRVKMITEGKDVSRKLFISLEEKKEIIDHFYDLAILHLKKEIDFYEPEIEWNVFKHLMWLEDSPFVQNFKFIDLISEKALTKFSALENPEKIKELLYNWYQSRIEKPSILDYDSDRVEKAMDYRYLFNKSQKEGIAKNFREAFIKRFQKIKDGVGGYYAATEYNLKKLTEDIYLLEEFEK